MPDVRQQLLAALVERSYRWDPVRKFRLASGRLSDYYLECKRTTFRADCLPLVGRVLHELVKGRAVACGGLTQGADPLALALAYYSAGQDDPVQAFSVRKQPKPHGTQRRIEGCVNPGDRVFVLDDVVTTGDSTVTAIRTCREEGLDVRGVVVLVDREEDDGRHNIQAALGPDLPVRAVFTRMEIEAARCALHRSPPLSPNQADQKGGHPLAETQGWQDETVQVAGTELAVTKRGSGPALLVLHEELGHPGITRWHEELARTHTVMIPHHPGFGKSPRVEWVNNVRDLAGFYSQVLQDQGLAPTNVIGFSLGGWVAAEMAAANAGQFRRLVLVGATGIRPPEGEIKDMFVVTARAYLDASVADMENTPEFAKLYGGEQTPEQYEAWEDARAETARIAWQPYMFYPSLGPLLAGAKDLPTLIIWGRDDAVVPLSAGQAYNKAIPGSELVAFDNCGHRPEIEQADAFVERVRRFLA